MAKPIPKGQLELAIDVVGFDIAKISDSDYETWEAIVERALRLGRGVQWAVGDLLNYGEDKFGETYAQAVTLDGYESSTIQRWKFVSRMISREIRSEMLSFSHHAEIAGIPEKADIAALIVECEDEMWTVAELRAIIKERYGEKDEKDSKQVSFVAGTVKDRARELSDFYEAALDENLYLVNNLKRDWPELHDRVMAVVHAVRTERGESVELADDEIDEAA